jgi:hypothetical protein
MNIINTPGKKANDLFPGCVSALWEGRRIEGYVGLCPRVTFNSPFLTRKLKHTSFSYRGKFYGRPGDKNIVPIPRGSGYARQADSPGYIHLMDECLVLIGRHDCHRSTDWITMNLTMVQHFFLWIEGRGIIFLPADCQPWTGNSYQPTMCYL